MTHSFKLFSVLVLLVALSSCDCTYDYEYEVNNQTAGDITVVWSAEGITDSMNIAPNTSERFTVDHGFEQCMKGPFNTDVALFLQEFEVLTNEGRTSGRDYRSNDAWRYSEEKSTGIYRTAVTEGEF